jgi:cellulose/xylan binding protein with CBM9 domain
VFPDVFGSKQHPAELLYQVRRELADGIEGVAETPVDVPHAPELVDLAGDLHEFAASPPIAVAAGAANAEFRLLWDENNLYVAATVADADLRTQGTGRDGPLYNSDSVEVMLDPQLTQTPMATSAVMQVIASVAGDLYDARGAGSAGDATFDITGLDARAVIHGTLNDAVGDTGYQIVIAIPWQSPVAADQMLGVDLALDNLSASSLTFDDWAGVRPFAQPRYWHQVRLAPDMCH